MSEIKSVVKENRSAVRLTKGKRGGVRGSTKSKWSTEASKGLLRWRDSQTHKGRVRGFSLVATNDGS